MANVVQTGIKPYSSVVSTITELKRNRSVNIQTQANAYYESPLARFSRLNVDRMIILYEVISLKNQVAAAYPNSVRIH